MAPRSLRPTRWNVFLPVSMPRTATVSVDWRGMAGLLIAASPVRRGVLRGAPPVHPISGLGHRQIIIAPGPYLSGFVGHRRFHEPRPANRPGGARRSLVLRRPN